MCLIVDNNLAADFFCGSNPDLAPLQTAVFNSRCCLHYGGKLREEYFRSSKVRRMLLELDRAGRAKAVPDALVDEKTVRISTKCSSDDAHVVALALVSGSRLLCSRDQALHADFTNPELVNNPRGVVYQNPRHKHLIRKHCKSC